MVISGTVKYPSDRLFKNDTRRKVVFNTPQGEITVWGDANDPALANARKGQNAQLLGEQSNSGQVYYKIQSIGSNGNYQQQPVNGGQNGYHNQYQQPGAPPATGYPQQGPPITPPVTGQQDDGENYNIPDPFELDERANLYRRLYVHIWNELTNDEKMPQVSDDVRQKCVATIFIQACRG